MQLTSIFYLLLLNKYVSQYFLNKIATKSVEEKYFLLVNFDADACWKIFAPVCDVCSFFFALFFAIYYFLFGESRIFSLNVSVTGLSKSKVVNHFDHVRTIKLIEQSGINLRQTKIFENFSMRLTAWKLRRIIVEHQNFYKIFTKKWWILKI